MREQITTEVKMEGEYLTIQIRSPLLKEELLKKLEGLSSDSLILFWGEDSIRETLKSIDLTTSQRIMVKRGNTIGKRVKASQLMKWVAANKYWRLYRESLIKRIDKVSDELSRYTLREERLKERAQQHVNSDTIPGMDGSAFLWLHVILSAKKDFLKYYWEVDKEKIEDFTSARSFLFDERYHIPMDTPESIIEGNAKYVNLRDILGMCTEQWRRTDNGVTEAAEPSVELLRAKLARATNDPKLIAQFCIQFSGIDKDYRTTVLDIDDEDLE